jgi:hypothetical protein
MRLHISWLRAQVREDGGVPADRESRGIFMRAGSIAILNILAGVMSAAALAEPRASGSGFAIGDGSIIITSNYVVEGCSGLNIPDIGPATLLKSDPRADLAILKPNRPLATGLRFRSGHPVKLGEEIVVIGYLCAVCSRRPPTALHKNGFPHKNRTSCSTIAGSRACGERQGVTTCESQALLNLADFLGWLCRREYFRIGRSSLPSA